jgi:hypothetical protein
MLSQLFARSFRSSKPDNHNRGSGRWYARAISQTLLATFLIVGCGEFDKVESGASGTSRACVLSDTAPTCRGGSENAVGAPYFLESYVTSTTWGTLRDTMAADSQERLFVTDGSTVWMILDGAVSVWLSAAEVFPVLGGVRHMTVGADDLLYLRSGTFFAVSDGSGSIASIPSSGGSVLRSFQVDDASMFWAMDESEGVLEVDNGTGTMIYSEADLFATDRGQAYDFKIDLPAGHFYFLAGNLISPLIRGQLDGSGAEIILLEDEVENSHFHGLGHRPQGGVFLSVGDDILSVDADGFWVRLQISPTIRTLVVGTQGHVSVFVDHTLGVSPNEVIYAHSLDPNGHTEIFRMTPL